MIEGESSSLQAIPYTFFAKNRIKGGRGGMIEGKTRRSKQAFAGYEKSFNDRIIFSTFAQFTIDCSLVQIRSNQ